MLEGKQLAKKISCYDLQANIVDIAISTGYARSNSSGDTIADLVGFSKAIISLNDHSETFLFKGALLQCLNYAVGKLRLDADQSWNEYSLYVASGYLGRDQKMEIEELEANCGCTSIYMKEQRDSVWPNIDRDLEARLANIESQINEFYRQVRISKGLEQSDVTSKEYSDASLDQDFAEDLAKILYDLWDKGEYAMHYAECSDHHYRVIITGSSTWKSTRLAEHCCHVFIEREDDLEEDLYDITELQSFPLDLNGVVQCLESFARLCKINSASYLGGTNSDVGELISNMLA